MTRILLLLVTLASIGCAFTENNQVDLYDKYKMLQASVKESNITRDMNQYFTSTYLEEIDLNDKKSLLLLLLPSYLDKVESHYQKINDIVGCLTVNGYEKNGSPLALYLDYSKVDQQWLVSYIHMEFMENSKSFTDKPMCQNKLTSK